MTAGDVFTLLVCECVIITKCGPGDRETPEKCFGVFLLGIYICLWTDFCQRETVATMQLHDAVTGVRSK